MQDSPYSGKDTAAYISAVEALVGDQDPLEILGRMSRKLAEFFANIPENSLALPEADGKWSMRQVVDHLFDVELVYGERTRMTLASDQPRYLNMDQDEWAARNWYGSLNLQSMLDALGSFRNVNIAMLSSLSTEQKQRFGIHSKRGNESISDLIRRWAGHDLLHLRQLDRIRIAVG